MLLDTALGRNLPPHAESRSAAVPRHGFHLARSFVKKAKSTRVAKRCPISHHIRTRYADPNIPVMPQQFVLMASPGPARPCPRRAAAAHKYAVRQEPPASEEAIGSGKNTGDLFVGEDRGWTGLTPIMATHMRSYMYVHGPVLASRVSPQLVNRSSVFAQIYLEHSNAERESRNEGSLVWYFF